MPHVLYIRGCPGAGKHTVAKAVERLLGWPRLWSHHFDPVYRIVGDHRVPGLTDKLMRVTASYFMDQKRSLIVVRPSRQTWGMECIQRDALERKYSFIPVRLTATYETMLARVESRQNESPFRVNTREGLDEYLNSRNEEVFPGENVIGTDMITAEEVAAKIRELIPTGS
jgi:shikimate kinase